MLKKSLFSEPYKFLRFMLPESYHISYLFDSVMDALSDYIMKFVKDISLRDKYEDERIFSGYGFDENGKSKKVRRTSELLPTERPFYFLITNSDKKWVMSVNKNKGQREIILSLNFKEIQRMYDFILLNNADIDSFLTDVKAVDFAFKEKIQDNL